MVIACVVPATEDSANIIAWQMAQDYDKDGERTIGEICAAPATCKISSVHCATPSMTCPF